MIYLYICCYLAANSCPPLCVQWTIVCQTPLSFGFSRQEYWCGVPFPTPRGSSPVGDRTWLPSESPGKPSVNVGEWIAFYILLLTNHYKTSRIVLCVLQQVFIVYFIYFTVHLFKFLVYPLPSSSWQLLMLPVCHILFLCYKRLICIIFYIPHGSDSIWYLPFFLWLTSFSKIISRSIHVAGNGIVPFVFMDR